MINNKSSFLKMGGLAMVLVLTLTVLVSMAGASFTAAPAQAPLNAPQAAIDNPATCTVAAGSVVCDLYAETGTLALPYGITTVTVPIWGYSDTDGGAAQLPGPTIIATEGDVVTINLTNNLLEDTALMFPGQAMIPDLSGAAANGGVKSYTFTASNPGTYLYEAGTLFDETGLLPNAAHQVAMGMFGALIVRPALDPAYAYDATSSFDDEALLVLSEIDPDLNADPTNFDMRDFVPQYRLINGKAYPETDEIPAAEGNRILLRYVNAGIQQHTMGVLGMDQSVIARDSSLRPYPQRVLTESIGPGRTADAILTVPASAGTLGETHFALYDASLLLHNNGAGFGGMLTFLTVIEITPPGAGPTTNAMDLAPNPTDGSVDVTLSATISGTSTITNAEYFVDGTGEDEDGCAMTVVANTGSVSVTTTIPAIAGATPPCVDLPALAHGDHTFYIHGSDGTWGAFNFAVLHLDLLGPSTTGISLAPNPSDGSVAVAVSATGNDTATGNSDIAAAEYFIGATGLDGEGTPMSVNVAAPIASLDGVIAAEHTEGEYIVSVHSMDSFGQWGDYATATLTIDQGGPVTSNVTADPAPNNGALPYSPTVFAVRVDATLTDASDNILRAEGFIDTIGADGEGFPLSPRDGQFNEMVEDAYVYIPLSTISPLAEGPHPIWVHGQDASGNWGEAVAKDLIIDKTNPSVDNVSVNPPIADGTAPVILTATASDADSDIDKAEWFKGADPGQGNGTPMTVTENVTYWDLSATIDLNGFAAGGHTLYVRARDAAGNWSPTGFVFLTVDTPTVDIFFDSFAAGNFAAWTAATGTGNSVIPAAEMDGDGFGLAVNITGGGPGYVVDGTPASETIYNARFYFNPNGALSANNAPVDIFEGLDAGAANLFNVQYRYRKAQGGSYQVRGMVSTPGGEDLTRWVNISNAAHSIEIAWESGTNASFGLYVDGNLEEALTGLDTSAYLLNEVQMGLPNGLDGNPGGVLYFDAFGSTRGIYIGPIAP